MKARKLFIIGNGFDLHHNLPTRFLDFYNFLKASNLFHLELPLVEDFWWDNDGFWSDFENSCTNQTDEELFQRLPFPNLTDDHYDTDFNSFLFQTQSLHSFSENLSDYLHEWVKNIDFNNVHEDPDIEELFDLKKSIYLSFNYTDTLERIYHIPSNQIKYIHGKGNTSDKLVCGGERQDCIFDPDDSYGDFRANWSIRELQGYLKEMEKPVTKIIGKNEKFWASLSDVYEVYVMGPSLGNVDMPYFEKIVKSVHFNSKWTFYYHQKNDGKDDSLPYKDFAITENIEDVTLVSW